MIARIMDNDNASVYVGVGAILAMILVSWGVELALNYRPNPGRAALYRARRAIRR